MNVFTRPEELARDNSTTIDVLNYHFLHDLSEDTSICTLQPTSPIRLPGTLDKCLAEYIRHNPVILSTGYQCKIQEFGANNNLPRQEIKGFFYDDGNIYVHSPLALEKKIWSSSTAHKFFTQEIENYEIDTEIDLMVVEFLMRSMRGENGF